MPDPAETKRPIHDPAMIRRMEIAFELYEVGEQIMRQNLRRRNPDATDEEIERGIHEWLQRRPGAEHGDAEGRPGSVDRFRR